jgi:hypothetical protein
MRLTLKLFAWLVIPVLVVGDTMPAQQQNALVMKYCAVCHNDTQLNGGLSVEHFDAAHADPSVAAMLLSKLTNGLPLERVSAANVDPAAAAAIDNEMKDSAIDAAGVPVPDSATFRALVLALSAEAAHATEWTANQVQHPVSKAQMLTASIVREVAAANDPAKVDIYRLTLTCRADTHEAEMQLAWAPGAPEKGHAMFVSVNGRPPLTYEVEGREKMGRNRLMGNGGPGAIILAIPLPEKTLTVGNLVGGKTVAFPFDDLPQVVRQCFAGSRGTSR